MICIVISIFKYKNLVAVSINWCFPINIGFNGSYKIVSIWNIHHTQTLLTVTKV